MNKGRRNSFTAAGDHRVAVRVDTLPSWQRARWFRLLAGLLMAGAICGAPRVATCQSLRYGTRVPQDVKLTYERGLRYLAEHQQPDGRWPNTYGSGVNSICLLAFLANGDDPNFGQHHQVVRRALRSIIASQNADTGYIPNNMYCHGFGMLALAESYGAVDDSQLWTQSDPSQDRRTIGEALELAVRCALTSQKNNRAGGWRYAPSEQSADTSVSGAVLIGLLAARNAGLEIPDQAVDRALEYFRSSTSSNGAVTYTGTLGSGWGQSMNLSSIATLVFAIGKRKDWKEYEATVGYLRGRLDHVETGYPFYYRYYMSQALFQGDFEAWAKWKGENLRQLKQMQDADGGLQGGQRGPYYSTAMALLSLALDYRYLPIYER